MSEKGIGAERREAAVSFDEARSLPLVNVKAGLRIKGKIAPFGGRWEYDKKTDELTLVDPPTQE